MASLKGPREAHRSLFVANQQRPLEESNLHTDLHQCPQGRISNEDGRHRQPTASRAGAEKSSEALYQPCKDVGATAPDESAMADTEILQPQLTQEVALVHLEKGGAHACIYMHTHAYATLKHMHAYASKPCICMHMHVVHMHAYA